MTSNGHVAGDRGATNRRAWPIGGDGAGQGALRDGWGLFALSPEAPAALVAGA